MIDPNNQDKDYEEEGPTEVNMRTLQQSANGTIFTEEIHGSISDPLPITFYDDADDRKVDAIVLVSGDVPGGTADPGIHEAATEPAFRVLLPQAPSDEDDNDDDLHPPDVLPVRTDNNWL